MGDMTDAIEVAGIRRTFKHGSRPGDRGAQTRVVALADVSINVSRGEIMGLLGPNGAGKTTLVKILSTVLLPTSGSARVLGYDVVRDAARIRERTGIVFGGERGLYGRLTVSDNLDYWAAMYHVPRRKARERNAMLLARVGLANQARTTVDLLSKGMKQRLHLARGLVNDPELVIMDEPTSGMDPVAAREFRSLVNSLRQDGRAILLTTHDMAEAEEICDRVALIDHGRILGIEHPRVIGRWLTTYERVDARVADAWLVRQITELAGVVRTEDIGDGWLRIHTNSDEAIPSILKLLVDSGINSIRTSTPSLEEVYLHVIGDRGLTV
jgi:ABC-2 type transport system ATP-binding protein